MVFLSFASARMHKMDRRILICTMITIVFSMMFSACLPASAGNSVQDNQTDATTGTDPGQSADTAGESNQTGNPTSADAIDADRMTWQGQGPGGPLRIWWTVRDKLNPLLEDSKSGQAVNDLIFQGLFQIKDDQSIEPLLAKNLTVWQSGLQVLIILEEGHTFHDGSPVTLQDAAACIDFVINPDNQSIYAAKLAAVESVQVIDNAAIELRLRRPDPWIAYGLTFPIIPAASLKAAPDDLIPGSGPYRMISFDADRRLRLLSEPEAKNEVLDEIIVTMYEDQLAAMQAMERDELDLVYLNARDSSRYIQRSNLRMSTFPGNELFLVLLHSAAGRPLADADRFALVKQQIQASKLVGTEAADWGELTGLGIPDGSWLASEFQADSTGSQLDVYAAALDRLVRPEMTWKQTAGDDEEPLQIVVAAEDARRVWLANHMAGQLAELEIPVSVVPLTVDLFWPALENGSYDLAVLAAVLPDSPDPTWLYRPALADPWSAADRLDEVKNGLADYADWQERLVRAAPGDFRQMIRAVEVDPEFSEILIETAVRSPWCVLEIMSEGLAYGDRVYGQCKPNRYHPYQNVEELWVWSGQSS